MGNEEYQWSDEHIRGLFVHGATNDANGFFRRLREDHFDEWLRRHDERLKAEWAAEASRDSSEESANSEVA